MELSAITIFFWLFATIAFFFSIGVISARSPMHSAISLVLTLVSLAGLFLLLHAEFLAWILIIVYTGAVMVLIIFVISLLNLQRDEPPVTTTARRWGILAIAIFLAAFCIYLFRDQTFGFQGPYLLAAPVEWGAAESVAITLFRDYLLPFEIASILLTAAVIGAIMVARKPLDGDSNQENKK